MKLSKGVPFESITYWNIIMWWENKDTPFANPQLPNGLLQQQLQYTCVPNISYYSLDHHFQSSLNINLIYLIYSQCCLKFQKRVILQLLQYFLSYTIPDKAIPWRMWGCSNLHSKRFPRQLHLEGGCIISFA